MDAVDAVFGALAGIIGLYLLLLIARMIISLILLFARDFRPQGPVVVVFEVILSLTDPPLKALRRVIPPLRIGQVAIDLAFLVLFIGLQLLRGLLLSI